MREMSVTFACDVAILVFTCADLYLHWAKIKANPAFDCVPNYHPPPQKKTGPPAQTICSQEVAETYKHCFYVLQRLCVASPQSKQLVNSFAPNYQKRQQHIDNFIQFKKYWVVVSNMFYFHPHLGKIPILANIFQLKNHQPE